MFSAAFHYTEFLLENTNLLKFFSFYASLVNTSPFYHLWILPPLSLRSVSYPVS